MKKNKILAVLLSVVMLMSIIPAFTINAAEVGTIVNGGFETGDFTGWDYYEWSTKITTTKRSGSYGVSIGKDSSLAGHIALEQIVPINTNSSCTLSYYVKRTGWSGNASFNVSVELGDKPTSFTYTAVSGNKPSISRSYAQRSVSFSAGEYKYARIRFNALGSGTDSYVDDIAMTCSGGDTGTHAAPSLTGFATVSNWPTGASNSGSDPANCTNNVIKQPGFEATTNAQWNSDSFLANGVSVITDASIARSGSKCLKYYRGSTAPSTWSTFEVTLPSAGDYVFSAWVRTPNLSADNQGKASIGIIDADTNKFLTYKYDHYSTPEIQIRSNATDDDWHLRAVTFYVGGASTIKIGMYGLKSTMYVDDISIHLLTNGTTYSGNQKGTLTASTSVSNKYCEAGDSLIPDSAFNGKNSKDFWTFGASGWNNGFLEFNQDPQHSSRGTTLHYKTTGPASNKKHYYIKFVYVEPNTSYTVSFDYRVAAAGNNLMFIDNNIDRPEVFHTPSLGAAANSWKTYAFTFNTGNYNRIGIVFQDGTGEAYYDDFRFFKTSDGISTEPEEELFPTLKHEHTGKSRMEMDGGLLGLAFRFDLDTTGVTINNKHEGNYTNGKVEAFEDGNKYKLVKAGCVLTNNGTVGQDESAFVRESANTAKTVIDVNAKYLYNTYHKEYLGITHTGITYAMRITNIPEANKGTVIYARPYYVFDYNGREVTVYGDIVYDSYDKMTDINDGWLEWD